MHTPRLYCLASLLLSFALTAGCQQSDAPEVTTTDDGTLRLGPVEAVDTVSRAVALNDRPLVFNGFRGSITLRGSDAPTADLLFIQRGRGQNVEAARSVGEEISVTESGSPDAYTYSIATETDDLVDYAAVDIQGTMPRQGELRIDRLTGPVRVFGVEGPLTILHRDGPVHVDGAAASVDVNIRNGDVQVGFRALPADATVTLRTTNGDIQVSLPPEASAQIDAQTNVGPIRAQQLSLSREQFRPQNAGGHYQARLGAGEAQVNLDTENGSITIQAADTTRREWMIPGPGAAPDSAVVPPSDTVVTLPTPQPDTASEADDTLSTETPTPPDTGSVDDM